MGREAVAVCTWQGQVAEVKAFLESQEIILRGEIKAKIPRAMLGAPMVDQDELVLAVGDDRLVLELGHVEAGKWQAALLKPRPTLANKLGVDTCAPAYVLGNSDDPELALALKDATTPEVATAVIFVAIIESERDLEAAFQIAQTPPSRSIWCIYGKGKHATVTDAVIRTFMRGQAYVDTKSCAVSERLTATRYGRVKS
jgi:hypothetical protein